MKRIRNIKQELTLTDNHNKCYDVHITGNIRIEIGFDDEVLVYGRGMDDLIHINTDFGDADHIKKRYTNGATISIVRRPRKARK